MLNSKNYGGDSRPYVQMRPSAGKSPCPEAPGTRLHGNPITFLLKVKSIEGGSSRLPAEGVREKHNVRLSPVAWRSRFQSMLLQLSTPDVHDADILENG